MSEDRTELDLATPANDRNARELHRARRLLFKQLIQVRKDRRYSQQEVADAIDINRSGVCRFESERENANPTLDIILRYAHAVGAHISFDVQKMEEVDRGFSRVQAWSGHTPWSAPRIPTSKTPQWQR
ncbi:helix-turn-helix transcriptional regulator [Gordonia soli]|nr:helix-turn-helix transcriptional regulator [Gordonia soli]